MVIAVIQRASTLQMDVWFSAVNEINIMAHRKERKELSDSDHLLNIILEGVILQQYKFQEILNLADGVVWVYSINSVLSCNLARLLGTTDVTVSLYLVRTVFGCLS